MTEEAAEATDAAEAPEQPPLPSAEELLDTAVAAIGGTPRPGQIAMTNAVDDAFSGGSHLAVQAGTGTGKSLAYLVPALRHAVATKQPVIVSTATIALQNQLVDKDLPRLAEALAPQLRRTPTFALRKGRSNYLCLHKLAEPSLASVESADTAEAATPETDAPPPDATTAPTALGRQYQRLFRWAKETETGDRTELVPGVDDRVWAAASSTSEQCLGTRCQYVEDCFAEWARHDAAEVDIVVTNHALLAIDAMTEAPVLPKHELVVVDEAHELVDVVTNAVAEQLSVPGLRSTATQYGKAAPENNELLEGFRDRIDDLEVALQESPEGRWREIPKALEETLSGLDRRLRGLRVALTLDSSLKDDEHAEREALQRRLDTQIDATSSIITHFEDGEGFTVVWREGKAVRIAPISVADDLAEHLFSCNTVVLTSATLALGGDFSAMGRRWGLRSNWDSLDVGSPFDPAASAILYVARHLPAPHPRDVSPLLYDEMAELITAAGGRTLGLFSSWRGARAAAQEMRERLDVPILLQGEDSLPSLVSQFAADEPTCLFGTLSLWQGVNVPGRTSSLVIIDRIPFPHPDDPLTQARSEAAGRQGFKEVSIPHAALLLAQGTGRLLRSITDRGVIAILDPRLVTKSYGGFLRKSLPGYWPTTDHDKTVGALRRLVGNAGS